jgi:hypothetical protein
MSKKRNLWLTLVILAIAILNILACNIETDMDRSWMTATVDSAIVTGGR